MIRSIRKSKITKIVSSYLAIQLILSMIQPMHLMALTSGPSQPEFNSFTPIGTSDMVNLSSGDFNYNIPIMDVGGYPLNLAYDAGISMDQEASWVGLGWNLNVGQINRNVRGLPDDFNGDEMLYENSMKKNKTVGMTFRANPQIIGLEIGENASGGADTIFNNLGQLNFGLNVEHNNYQGISFKPSFGFSFNISENIGVGMNLTSSATEGVTVSPNVSLSKSHKSAKVLATESISGSLGVGTSYNSRQGLSSFNINASAKQEVGLLTKKGMQTVGEANGSGTISFLDNTYTPAKRTAYKNSAITFAISTGPDFFGVDAEFGIDAYGSSQSIKDKSVIEKGYGYQYSKNASPFDILDFNKEKDGDVSKNTLVLAPTNYTYDIYSIQGQGIGGMFRPFSGQVGYIFDQFVEDSGSSASLGGEFEGGAGFHVGVDLMFSPSRSHTGVWNTNAKSFFEAADTSTNKSDYEEVYFKSIGELRVDEESDLFHTELGGFAPVRLGIGGDRFSRYAQNKLLKKTYSDGPTDEGAITYPITNGTGITSKLKREHREKRNQAITSFTHKEVTDMQSTAGQATQGMHITPNAHAKPDHTAGMHILQPDGSTYVYGETAYNLTKEEVTFAVEMVGNCGTGEVGYSVGSDNSTANEKGIDEFFNRVVTPEYAHTYLLSSVLSSDYEDLTGDGVSDDDLGAYTKFTYTVKDPNYKWRVPFNAGKASFNEGLKTNTQDQKGSYIYGEKELKYIEKIETKTHVAIFDLSERKDGHGVKNENNIGAGTNGDMYKINTISLYTKPEYKKLIEGDQTISPIKVAHFVYDYSLAPGIPNNFGDSADGDDHEISNEGGKLTLQQVYFTYRDSKMGKYTPYDFNYDGFNPEYNLKGYDVWGNYKENEGGCSPQGTTLPAPDFPFVQQDDKALQDMYASAWTLTSIDLPSGGKLDVTYETDDYQYVQDKKAMRMFKIAGVTKDGVTPSASDLQPNNRNVLFNSNNFNEDARYLIVEIPDAVSPEAFEDIYVGDQLDEAIFFRFLTQMVRGQSQSYDYVEGYFKIKKELAFHTFSDQGKHYGAVPMEFSNMEGGTQSSQDVNPIAKASWYFGRKYLNRQVYGLELNTGSANFAEIANALGSSIAAVSEIFSGPNKSLRNKQCGRLFNPDKSWIRLNHGNTQKMGGGVRVQKIALHDQWDAMVELTSTDPDIVKKYKSEYGQEYDYTMEDGRSSGVATYEPNGSKENPLVVPFYNKGDNLVAPKELNYREKPFGESFFPSPTVTYRRVAVSNLAREEGNLVVKRHATGKVVNEFYSSYDFPTKTDFTTLNGNGYDSNEASFVNALLNTFLPVDIESRDALTLSQGFVVHTNDMNGKSKTQKVFNENGEYISGVEYKYNSGEDGELDNKLPVIYADGTVTDQKEIGVHYDVITDFRESYSFSETYGIQTNVAVLPIPFIPVLPFVFPQYSSHEKTLHTTTTTKVVHSTGILTEKIAHDLGSTVSTKNVAWDAASGQVLLTQTINEYDDQYYNMSFPAHWYYTGMDKATNNIGISGKLLFANTSEDSESRHLFTYANAQNETVLDVFTVGDELLAHRINAVNGDLTPVGRLWVVDVKSTGVTLMDKFGQVINQSCASDNRVIESDIAFKIVRSGYRNQHMATMASVTTQENPLKKNGAVYEDFDPAAFNYNGTGTNPKVVNASAVVYNDFWKPQAEKSLPAFPTSVNLAFESFVNPDNTHHEVAPEAYGFNPYLYNVRGDWRALRSFAHLTGRNTLETTDGSASPRTDGFFTSFNSFYQRNASGNWQQDQNQWTFASQVSQYSPYGAELENRDALNRYSAAQYGYNYTLPTAVGSNSQYGELGFDGFEDYAYAGNNGNADAHFSVYKEQDGAVLTEDESHTGRHSMKVTGGNTIAMVNILNTGDFEVTQPECDPCPTGCIQPDGSCGDCPPPPDCPVVSPIYEITIADGLTTFTTQELFGTTGITISSPNITSTSTNCSTGVSVVINPSGELVLSHACPTPVSGPVMIDVTVIISGVPSGCSIANGSVITLHFCGGGC